MASKHSPAAFLHSPVGQTRYSMQLRRPTAARDVCNICDLYKQNICAQLKIKGLKHHRKEKHLLADGEQLRGDSSQRQHRLIPHANKTCVQVKTPVARVNCWLLFPSCETCLGLNSHVTSLLARESDFREIFMQIGAGSRFSSRLRGSVGK